MRNVPTTNKHKKVGKWEESKNSISFFMLQILGTYTYYSPILHQCRINPMDKCGSTELAYKH